MTEATTPPADAEDTSIQTSGDTDSPEGTPVIEPEGSQVAPDWESDDNPYRKRYSDVQAWGTEISQENAQLRQLFDAARAGDKQALDYFGWDVADEPDETEFTTDEILDQRLTALEQERAQASQQAQLEQEAREFEEAEQAFYEHELTRLDPQKGFSDEYKNMVIGVAQSLIDDDGLPNLEEAHKQLQAHFDSQLKDRISSKRRPQAPSGASPQQTPDLDDDEQRRDHLYQKMMEAIEEPVE